VIIGSLILSSISALGMGFAPSLEIFIAVTVIVGTLSSIGGPAHEAVVADLLPEEKRAEGYGIIRVIFNLAVIIAPPIAGLLIANSYLTLFIVDAVISLIAASIVILALPETKPKAHPDAVPETMKQTFAGYGRVFRNTPFVLFIGSTFAAIPPILIAVLKFDSIMPAVWVAVYFTVINVVLGGLVEPRLMGQRLNLSPLLVILSLLFWGWLWGVTGMALSVPIMASIKIVCENIPQLRFVSVLMSSK
jgi:MFS family permease